ncbi:ABC transporter substrate-binding protein [Amycolatopsis cihanbeyliensis]|uniref:NitT/TauT family transport system substrate-binding protein n=1 Tax=Amycolatopsis cihanbeyliensis TaxID=1128664 RepID=A0A542DIK2_AMYCI|nr:ABC transporter substrate-binding protein [Amycolatopsis cihanbeyliensis]TQJ02932.1 NitT/TauT family transport system substrate-binding protein [Amycolatopsis cihanbeyliensis]
MLRNATRTVRSRSRRTRLGILATSLVMLASVSGCGLLGGESDDSSGGGDGPLEQSKLTVSIMPTIDLAPLHLAMKNGYFKEEGLEIETVSAKSGQASLAKLIGGEVDIAYSSYSPFFLAQSKGAANLKFVADASSAAPNSTLIMAMPDSKVQSVQDLEGKRVGITALGTIIEVLVKSTMQANGVDFNNVEWVEIPFPDTAAALQNDQVDAAFLTEPFITQAEKSVGAVPVADTAKGPTKDFPTAGYGSSADFADKNPETIAAFQRVMQKATNEALADRSKIEPLLVEHSKIDADTASLATLLTFQSALDPQRLQRVPDLLLEFGIIEQAVDASQMIAQPSAD